MDAKEQVNKEMIQWAITTLSSHGYQLKSNLPEQVQDTPWSYVVRFVTSDGYIYLKNTPKLLALEATIIQMLRDQFQASVPEIIAHNTELNCFLTKDAGQPLRGILKRQFDTGLICKAIQQFTSLQLAVTDHINDFLVLGVPDWRLEKLPDLYKQLLAQKELLIADGLSETEINQLEALQPRVSDLCKNLSSYAIKQTIVQPDFQDNNLLINTVTNQITLIDLGEIAISHPFFSLLVCLQQIKRHHAITEDDERYLKIKDACLENYRRIESQKHLLEAFETAELLLLIYGALCSYRLMVACGKEKFTGLFQRHGRVGLPLKEFIAACGD